MEEDRISRACELSEIHSVARMEQDKVLPQIIALEFVN